MAEPRLKIYLDQQCILSARSRSANGILSFMDDVDPECWHNGGRRLSSLLDPHAADRIARLDYFEQIDMRVNLVDWARLGLRRPESEGIILTDCARWWLPFEDVTLSDVLEECGLRQHAEPLDIADPFSIPA
jgi:hypothetical protein